MWEKVKLGDVATFVNGYAFKPSDWSDEGLEIIRIQNLTKSSSESNYYKGVLDSKYQITRGDILISWSATLGVYIWERPDGWLNQHIFKVVFNKIEINKPFFIYLIQHVLDDLKAKVHGATMKHITKGNFDNTLVPLPPLPIQEKIAAILDKADELRRKDKGLQAKYDELAQAIFIDMFGDPVRNEKGWEVKKLEKYIDSIVDVGSNGANDWVSKNIQMKDTEDYAIMIRTTNLTKNDFINNLKYVSRDTYELFNKTKVYGGEMIMNKIGSAGDFWLMPYLNRPVSLGLNQLMIKISNINMTFLLKQMSINSFKKYIKSKTQGAITKSITKGAVKDLEIILPPIALQEEFAKKIDIINKLKAQANTAKSEELFQVLLQKAFNGKLVS